MKKEKLEFDVIQRFISVSNVKKTLILQPNSNKSRVSIFFKTSAVLLVLILSVFLPAYTQSKDIFDKIQFDNDPAGKIRIVQSDSLSNLVNLHLWEEKKMKGIRGYRIRIYRGTGPTALKKLEAARATFIQYHSDNCESYTDFDYPDYLFAVGDFRTYSEALKFMKSIERDYPNRLYIYQTRINYPKL